MMNFVADIPPVIIGQAPKRGEGAFGLIVSEPHTYGHIRSYGAELEITKAIANGVSYHVFVGQTSKSMLPEMLVARIEAVPSGYVTAKYLARMTGISEKRILDRLENDKVFAKSYMIGPNGEDVYRLRSAKSRLADLWAAFRDLNYKLSG